MDPSVKQKILAPNSQNIPGDCLKTCVSQLLGIDYDLIPHFALFQSNWREAVELWAEVALPNKTLYTWGSPRKFKELEHNVPQDVNLMIAVGDSIRGTRHVIIVDRNFTAVYDPHPSEAGLESIYSLLYFRDRP